MGTTEKTGAAKAVSQLGWTYIEGMKASAQAEQILKLFPEKLAAQYVRYIQQKTSELQELVLAERQQQEEAIISGAILGERPREQEQLQIANDYLRSLATQERRLAARVSQQCDELSKRNEELVHIVDRLTRENAALIDLRGMRAHAERQQYDGILRNFYRLMATWKTETCFLSNINEKCAHPAYQEIIEMGRDVVPLILEELKREPDHWFAALRKLTGENPVPPGARGKLKDMALAWLEWANKHEYSPESRTGLPEAGPAYRLQEE
jgi:hypothetical protein